MLQLQIEHCHRDEVEQLTEDLEATEALSITLTDMQDDPILEPELGTMPLWPHVVVQALYANQEAADVALELLSTRYSHLNYSLQTLPEQDWERVCMDDFKPQRFGERLWITPTWQKPPEPDAVNLVLDPGLAFGTGTHPTTHLCLTWLEQAQLDQKQVIDYGCGSGILAIAALKLGALHVAAVDIDPQALLATQNNAAVNAISSTQLSIDYPDTLSEPVDLILANILLTPLIQLKNRFDQLLNEKGLLVVSGILAEQVETLIDAYQPEFKSMTVVTQDDWGLIVFSP